MDSLTDNPPAHAPRGLLLPPRFRPDNPSSKIHPVKRDIGLKATCCARSHADARSKRVETLM
jgi:hypothetical protein